MFTHFLTMLETGIQESNFFGQPSQRTKASLFLPRPLY